MPGLITAIGGLIGAVAVLIGALAAAGVIGSDGGSSSVAPTSSSTADGTLANAGLHGDWTVTLTLRVVVGAEFFGENKLWGFVEPHRDDERTETWTLDSICPESPCDVRFESVETPNRFSILRRVDETGTYIGHGEGSAGCDSGHTPVRRDIELRVVDPTDIDGVWSAQSVEGEITISWTCFGHELGGIVDVIGNRALT
jgi:hypothetical protein